MKIERLHITVFLVFAAAVWWIVLLIQGTGVTPEHAKPFSVVMTALVLFGIALEKCLWCVKVVNPLLVKRPDLRGTWKIELQSSYVRPETGEQVLPITCYMGVKQTLSSLTMHLMTPESESWSLAERIRESPNGHGFQLIVVYTNEPNLHLRDERISEMHQGAFIAETHGDTLRPSTLTAKYWTDRKTNGTMTFLRRVKEVHTRIEDAQAAFETPE